MSSPVQPADLITLPTGDQVRAQQDAARKWSFPCSGCDKVVNLGLSVNVHIAHTHWNSAGCKKIRAARLDQQRRNEALQHAGPSRLDPSLYPPTSRAAEIVREQLSIRTESLSTPISHPVILTTLTPISETATPPITPIPVSASTSNWDLSCVSHDQHDDPPMGSDGIRYPCPGFKRSFPSIYSGYAFAAHDRHTLKWEPVTFHPEDDTITFRSSKCECTMTKGIMCTHCQSTSKSVALQNFLDRAKRSTTSHLHTSHDLLTAEQLSALTHKWGVDKRRLATHVCPAKSDESYAPTDHVTEQQTYQRTEAPSGEDHRS
jgi:hypothetical protein